MTQQEIATLFDAHFEEVYRYIYCRIQHRETTEDIVSTIFEKIVRHHYQYQPQHGATVRSWIFSIVRHALIDQYRKRRSDVVPIESVDISDDKHSVVSDIDTSLQAQKIFPLINSLPEQKREIVLLRYQGQLSNKEIAQVLDIDQHTVSSLLSKAIKQLRHTYFSQYAHV